MPIPSHSSSTWMLSLKVLLISTGVLSMAVMFKLSLPVMTEFAISEVPLIWSFVVSWLRPPYLYLVINCIIITIVASSKLQHKVDESPSETVVQPVPIKTPEYVQTNFSAAYNSVASMNTSVEIRPEFAYGHDENVVQASEPDPYPYVDARVSKTMIANASGLSGADELAISKSSWTPQRNSTFPTEKPLVSARFNHRKVVKASPEGGKALGVSKPKRQDTLENTWKTITDGRAMPLTRHLRKSDTWETHGRHTNVGQLQDKTSQRMIKSETFLDRSTNLSPSSGKLRKEPSLSQDELNRRVEAFIQKFNEEMRLQRQESLNKYMEMINRGAH
ncbi:hypothetical protein F0562_010256 [Nyssa sinensis]|uniref:DUF4408 domain-containing protein n=1 Tax=Nyssa sinensis TaxID=561372 RepID=A0A5J4ZYC6_9ASTE|nr:hypothetical protein F0562_010256 [Nyssa sinensis]